MKLPKVYKPGEYESDIYALWEKSGVFQPRPGVGEGKGKQFSIVMPPPNANANLHIGYELTAVLEDIAARYHRAKGESVLLLPGADHAGFETQSVYEKQLAKEGKSRFDFSREMLYQQIWDFVALNRSNFEGQMRQMGVSCDWTRFTFTLDDKIVRRAYQTFKKMWDEGLIYRGERLVNFCTFHGTAFADIEVVHKEEQGHLWYLRYPLVDGSGEVVVATTRPETMLGDVAVAVNPNDERYRALVGKTVKLPLTHREVPIIADDFVDPKFGTGAVKITPAHDQHDFEAGKRHDLPSITVISHEGKLINVPEVYRGLTVAEARQRVVADLEKGGFHVKVEDHTHNVGHCYKCDTIIQPLLREQWFVDMQPLARRAIGALNDDQITFYPEAKKTQLITYLEGLWDWNISRQQAWGIPIPAFQNLDDPEDWIYDERVDQETLTIGDKTYRRDPDVFDTWFSSSSWPYVTLDYPDGEAFKQFYPLSLMETGSEILYPWVSRMIMLGLYVTDQVPFKEVYIHGYVMAEDGSKMSKSVGNTVDPLPVIAKYGSDALRMGIISGRTPAVNRGYDQRKVEEARNFCNKLWNVARFIETLIGDAPGADGTVSDATTAGMASGATGVTAGKGTAAGATTGTAERTSASESHATVHHAEQQIEAWLAKVAKHDRDDREGAQPVSTADHWILHRLAETQRAISSDLDQYRFSEAYDKLYHFVWDDLADWYIEVSKAEPNKPLLAYLLEAVLTLAHPFAPFVTETIWQTLAWEQDSILASRQLRPIIASDGQLAADFAEVQAIVTEARFILKALQVSGVILYYTAAPLLRDNAATIKRLTGLQAVTEVEAGIGLYLTSSHYKCWLNIDAATAKAYLGELGGKRARQAEVIKQLELRLANQDYLKNAPPAVVEQTRAQLQAAQQLLASIEQETQRFSGQ